MLDAGTQLKLRIRNWRVVKPLASPDGAGFGDLYILEGDSDSGTDEAVAKLVRKDPGAERELFIGSATAAAQYPNVMPVIDDGEHEDHWVLVMPRAEKSLAAHLASSGGALNVDEAVDVLRDVATALAGIDGELVHRDVKPQNVLLFGGAWCLTDFGIARYADATTANDTRKGFLSKAYAAPEQWRFERATSAADVYALGCIGYELLTGDQPFPGPDFREQHLNSPSPDLKIGPTRLRVLIEECLYKAPAARPTPAGILKKLEKIGDEPKGSGLAKLAEANRVVVKQKSDEHVRLSAEQQARERRETLHNAAASSLEQIGAQLLEAIADAAPSAALNDPRTSMDLSPRADLLAAELLGVRFGMSKPWLSAGQRQRPFEVISEAAIMLKILGPNRYGWSGRSHSLWFCDAHEEGRFAWYETAFMSSPLLAGSPPIHPFWRKSEDAETAIGPGMGVEQVAWPFEELDRADLDEFLNRWLGWFGDAAQGKLSQPSTMPEKPAHDSWRKS